MDFVLKKKDYEALAAPLTQLIYIPDATLSLIGHKPLDQFGGQTRFQIIHCLCLPEQRDDWRESNQPRCEYIDKNYHYHIDPQLALKMVNEVCVAKALKAARPKRTYRISKDFSWYPKPCNEIIQKLNYLPSCGFPKNHCFRLSVFILIEISGQLFEDTHSFQTHREIS